MTALKNIHFMRITRHPFTLTHAPACALTIGNFDGVHVGHAEILRQLVREAHTRGLTPTVMTFEPHPKAFFASAHAPRQILPLRNKLALLAEHGIEHTIVLPFNAALAHMTARDFVAQLLCQQLNMRYLLIGDDFKFGAKRTGDFALLRAMSNTHSFALHAQDSIQLTGERVSSSAIRHAIAAGQLNHATALLGHPLTLSGHVMHGQQLGRTIGCPTINLKMPHLLAAQGIYAVQVCFDSTPLQGVASIGTRPTVANNGQCWLEVHILDFERDVYGQLAHVTLQHKIRDEAKFDGLEALKNAIAQDIQEARGFFAAK
ncbi:MAG: bifunctional riboflavin kinase/FAD synthetase [Formosimonas sp.]